MTYRLRTVLGLTLLLAASPAGAQESAATWPQWRGPQRDGRVTGPAWPDKLQGDRLKQLWRVPLDRSYSGPVVAGDRVFTTETKDRKDEAVHALDRKTGKVLWRASWPGSLTVPFFAARNGSWIRSTPAWDGERLYVAGMRDVLVCLDGGDGKELWRFDFVKEFKTALPSFGFVCSPLVDGDHLYVQAGAAFVKLEKRTGKVLWRTLQDDGGMYGSAFSSPALATLGGQRQLLVQTRTKLAGVHPDTGAVLWTQEVPAFRGMNILTPTAHGEGVFTSSYGGKSFFYGIVSEGGQLRADTRWTNKTQGYMSSPVVVGDHLYLHLRSQHLTCIDLRSGETKWTTDERFGQYWSLAVNGDRILALDQTGVLYLLRANPERFELLDRRQVSEEETWAHLAVAGNEVFVRELNALAAYRWE